jgi:hypothetical protein
MESQVLNSPQLLKTLYDGFIAVKVNTETDKGAKAVSRFKIQGLPTDMVLSPEGKVLVRTQGYDSSSKPGYLASISRIDTSYKTSGQRLPRGDETTGWFPIPLNRRLFPKTLKPAANALYQPRPLSRRNSPSRSTVTAR